MSTPATVHVSDKSLTSTADKSSTSRSTPAPSSLLKQSALKAIGGGASGAAAMSIQVVSLMWMRTAVNYQYRTGAPMMEDGGIPRFYRGLLPALFQGPLSRFGDTAANTGVLAFMDGHESTQNMPVAAKTLAASGAAALWRICLMPIDTLKTTLQVNGSQGMSILRVKMGQHGVPVLFHGSLAAFGATFVGHFPWFFTYNHLQKALPRVSNDKPLKKMGRNALIGFVSSAVSDSVSNAVRVVKTYRQTHAQVISYPTAVRDIVAQSGVLGLMGRGLQTKIISNGLQGILFSVLWKFFEEKFRV